MKRVVASAGSSAGLLQDVRELIVSTRQTVARGVNAALVLLYWKVGERIRCDVLKEKRAEYGEEIVSTLSAQLVPDFGAGFALRNLRRMIQFSEVFPDPKIVSALSTQLGWSHFVELLPLKKQLQRGFYAEMCRVERWSVRTLRQRIDGMLYERTALSRRPNASGNPSGSESTGDRPLQCPRISRMNTYPRQRDGNGSFPSLAGEDRCDSRAPFIS
jgi:hypothetical protein